MLKLFSCKVQSALPSDTQYYFLNGWLVKRAQPITAIQHLTKERKQQTPKIPKSEKTTKQLLGLFYSDKKYLENLLKDEGTMLFILCEYVFFFFF